MTGTDQAQHEIVDAVERQRFELRDGDDVLAFAEYRRRPGLIAFTHTKVED